MADQARRETLDLGTGVDVPEEDTPRVTAHSTTPDRIVFTEADNKNGWIATDLAVDCWR